MRVMLVIGWLVVGCSENGASGGRPETTSEADGSQTDSVEELDDGTGTDTTAELDDGTGTDTTAELDDGTGTDTTAELEVDTVSEPDVTAPLCFADFPCAYFGDSATCVGTEIAPMINLGCEAVCTLPCTGVTCGVGAAGPCPTGETCIEIEPRQAFCGRPGDTCGGDASSACDADAN